MILDTIVAHKKQEVDTLRVHGIREPQLSIAPPRDFFRAVTSTADVAIIAEAKKASPSKGVIRKDFDPKKIALQYKEGGASAISVLTDEQFFQGSLSYIPLVRETVDLPVLRKDFIIHEIQIEEAQIYGADAILLIAAILDTVQIHDYHSMARELGMDVLVEVHNTQELEKTLMTEANLIGINNRNLQDFTVSLDTTFRLKKLIPENIPVVSESGIRDQNDMQQLRQEKIAAALIGETFMRASDPVSSLRQLLDF